MFWPSIHRRLVFRIELKYMLHCYQRRTAFNERSCGFIFHIVCGVAALSQTIFQFSTTIVDAEALSMKVTSINLVIVTLLKILCFVTLAMLM